MTGRLSVPDGLAVADVVGQRLFEAGCTLAALPAYGLKPGCVRVAWPEMLADVDLDWINAAPDDDLRPPRPDAGAVSRMDESLSWIGLIGDDRRNWRKVLCLRLIVHPISHRYRWTWRKIAQRLHTNHHTAKSWHELAVADIARKIVQPEIFTSQTSHFAA
ncbi:DUF6362 family protein [Novacetimonas hansenii]|uniref:DUF6362 family protein n=1 Tax=Novacetimonas hansenii TaxID=436 RepID=A0AAW5EM37_NOVHA|nr:DUF6362 family protein [Novacetimonas hansenii]MCJ8352709.1 DUF6362 family protein [Novacetimonas hansenii]PYD72876.1 hypothetical protein CFR74_07710 [Novacetimonas hansenii]